MKKQLLFRLLCLLCVLSSTELSNRLLAQVLYDNGPIFNSVGTGAGGANESVLYTTTFGMGTIGFGHQQSAFNRVADDFVINNCNWRLDSIVFFGYQTGSTTTSTFTGVNFRIWSGQPEAPGSVIVFGDTTTNRLTRTAWTGVYRITETTTGNTQRPMMRNVCALSNLELSNGTYWLDWQSAGSLASGPWAPARTPIGVSITGNGLQRTSGVWNNAVDGGTGTPAQGFPFVIYGTILDPMVDAGQDQSICAGNSAMLGGNPSGQGGQGPLSYLWSPSTGLSSDTIANPVATPASSASYILAVTDSAGCTVLDTVEVSVGTIASNFIGNDTTLCSGQSISLNAGAGNSYTWNTGDTTQSITVGTGTYWVSVDNGSGCASVDTIMVSASVDVQIIGNGFGCSNAGDTLSTLVPYATYLWSVGATTASIVVNQAGTYSVSTTDNFGCQSSDTFSVSITPAPTANFSFTVGAAGLTYSFTDLSSGAATYLWDFGDANTSIAASPSHTYAASGTYTVVLYVSNACGVDTFSMPLVVTSLEGSLALSAVEIAPNPANGQFKIKVLGLKSESLEVELTDLAGRSLKNWKIDQPETEWQQEVDVRDLAAGTYLLHLIADDQVLTKKVVLQ